MTKTTLMTIAGAALIVLSAAPALAQRAPGGQKTDFTNPIEGRARPDGSRSFHVTICQGAANKDDYVWNANALKARGTIKATNTDGARAATAESAGGTDMAVKVHGPNVGTSVIRLDLAPENGAKATIYLTVHVIRCDNSNVGRRGGLETRTSSPFPGAPTTPQLREKQWD